MSCRSLRAKEQVFRKIEGVLHIPRGVILGGVERGEVIIIRFNFRSFEHLKTHTRENVDQFVFDERDRVQCARLIFLSGHSYIHALGCIFFLHFHFPHNDGASFEFFFNTLLEFVDDFSKRRTIFLGKVFHSAHNTFELRLKLHFQFVKSSARFRFRHCPFRFKAQRFNLFFHLRFSPFILNNALRAFQSAQGEICFRCTTCIRAKLIIFCTLFAQSRRATRFPLLLFQGNSSKVKGLVSSLRAPFSLWTRSLLERIS